RHHCRQQFAGQPAGRRAATVNIKLDLGQARDAFGLLFPISNNLLSITLSFVGGSDVGREQLADDLVKFLESTPGTSRVRRDLNEPSPQVQATLQYDWLNYYGISAATVGDILKYAIDGQQVTRVFNGEEEVNFRVALAEGDQSFNQLNDLLVRGGNNQLVPLGKLVRWDFTDARASIDHFNGKRVIRVSSGVDATVTDPLAVFSAVQAAFAGKDYQGASIVADGQIQETRDAQRGLAKSS
ncbi:efflux RND transporter permease subunit, partial [Endozoicomonas sp. SESOKO1]|uniref:efflux RND transporter permease subunit n=1 Tax=Endozoicomonas sp. SESOKO1 TaxID=2828742 RepID=UPI00214997B5